MRIRSRSRAAGMLALACTLATGVALVPGAPVSAAAAPVLAAPGAVVSVPATSVQVAPTTWKPTRKVPRDSGKGARIVYKRSGSQHAWIIDAAGVVVRDFAVTGRRDWPRAGRYHVFSKSPWSHSDVYGVSWQYMVRFAHGHAAAIGFHSIPTRGGEPIQSVDSLGQALGLGGCVRSALPNARFLYRWARIGTKVIVL